MSGSSQLRSNAEHEYMKMFGDTVVGTYTEQGSVLKDSTTTFTPSELAARQRMYAQHASRIEGAGLLPTAVVKGKKAKKVKYVAPPTPIENFAVQEGLGIIAVEETKPTPVKKKHIYLHNKLGKIKMSVEAVLNSEMAFGLVFASEDDMIFTPNAGETLNFVDHHGDTTEVYFANTVFDWTDGEKKVMILFKTQDEE